MDECELIAFISTIACAIMKCYTTDEISLLSVVFSQLGDTLQTALTQRDLNSKDCNNDGNYNDGRNDGSKKDGNN